MPGGSPQGALLGVLLYLIYVSIIGMDLPDIPQTVPGVVDIPSVPFPFPEAVTELEARLMYVDYLSVAECSVVQSQLKQSGNDLYLPSAKSLLQRRLDDLAVSDQLNYMKLNLSITKIIRRPNS